MKKYFALLSLIPLLALTACSQTAETAQTTAPALGTYTVTQVEGKAVKIARPVTVEYNGEMLYGKGPINNWSSSVAPDGKLGPGFSTLMAGPSELMELEHKLLRSLEGGTLTAKGGELAVLKDGKTVVLLEPSAQSKSE